MDIKLTEKEGLARSKLCLPLDNLYDMKKEVIPIVKELSPFVGLFKVGKGSYTRFGQDIIKMIQDHGSNIFLDLKYHDIPNTVEDAADAATGLGVYMFNVHASGGVEMMRAAMEGVKEGSKRYGKEAPKITGVTLLTSLDEAPFLEVFGPLNPEIRNEEFMKNIRSYAEMGEDDYELQEEFETLLVRYGLKGIVKEYVFHLAKLAERAGLDGIVCSAKEVGEIKDELPEGFLYVTPGIRPPEADTQDQKRVMTPANAIEDGASILVVGRPIRKAKDRPEAAYNILQDMAKHL